MMRCEECFAAGQPADRIVEDRATGDSICTNCSLVLEAFHMDQGSEWLARPLPPSPDRGLRRVFDKLESVAGGEMHLPSTVLSLAKEMYQVIRTRVGYQDAMKAVCVYNACKVTCQEGVPRRKAEVCQAFGIGEPQFTRSARVFKDNMGDQPYSEDLYRPTRAVDLVARLCNFLGMRLRRADHQAVVRGVRAMEAHVKRTALLEGTTPKVVVTGLLYYALCVLGLAEEGAPNASRRKSKATQATQATKTCITRADVVLHTGVSVGTLTRVVATLYENRENLDGLVRRTQA